MNKQFVPSADSSVLPAEPSGPSQWHGQLRLEFAQTRRGVRLMRTEHRGPLYVQKPFYPEGPNTPHVYLLHPPGGLVSGDRLEIDIAVAADAHTLVTTPGAGRLYKARADQSLQRQSVRLRIAAGASIEWLPLEAILFPGAHAQTETRIDIAEGGKLIFWDVVSFGLPANGRVFDAGEFNQSLKIYRNGRLSLQERLVINATNRGLLSARAGLQDLPIQGLLVAGPFMASTELASTETDEAMAELIHRLRARCEASAEPAAITLIDGFIVARSLGTCSERTRQLFEHLWQEIRPALLDKPACAPRIWST
jgi:urease accessory protein